MNPITIIEVPIIWKNFSGERRQYNERGDRLFNIVISDENYATDLANAGWPVKEFLNREEGEEREFHMECKVNYASKYPPRIYLVKHEKSIMLSEATISTLDMLPISFVSVKLNPYRWSNTSGSGIKPYVDTMYAMVDQNELDERYKHLEEVSMFPSE